MQNHLLIDPACPEAKRFVASLFDDPATAACDATTDEVLAEWEQRHLETCERCRSLATVEVVD